MSSYCLGLDIGTYEQSKKRYFEKGDIFYLLEV